MVLFINSGVGMRCGVSITMDSERCISRTGVAGGWHCQYQARDSAQNIKHTLTETTACAISILMFSAKNLTESRCKKWSRLVVLCV